jgi:hypothetical protein
VKEMIGEFGITPCGDETVNFSICLFHERRIIVKWPYDPYGCPMRSKLDKTGKADPLPR